MAPGEGGFNHAGVAHHGRMAGDRPGRPRAWGLLVVALVLLAMSTFFSFGPLPTRADGKWVVCPVGLNALRWVSRAQPVPAAGSAQARARAVACATLANEVSAPVGLGLDGVAAVVLLIWASAQRRP